LKDYFLQSLQPSFRPSFILTLLLLMSTMVFRWQASVGAPTIDFFTAWAVGQSLKNNPHANIYASETQRQMASVLQRNASLPDASMQQKLASSITSQLYANAKGQVTGSPFFYATLSLFSTGHYETDRIHFIVCSFLFFIAAIVLLCYLLNYSLLATALALLFLSSCYGPGSADVFVGNVNQIQLLVVALCILCMTQSRTFVAGLILGLGMMFKPNIFLVCVAGALVYGLDRRYKKVLSLLLGAFVGMDVALAVSIGFCGQAATWAEFARSLSGTLGFAPTFEHENCGLTSLIYHWTQMRSSLVILGVLLAALGCVAALTRQRYSSGGVSAQSGHDMERERPLHDAFAIGGLGCGMMLLSSNLVWFHYYVLLIPTILYLIRPSARNRSRTSVEVLSGGLALMALLLLSAVFNLLSQSFVFRLVQNPFCVLG
jgi:hypothetical protein